jgi:hypothetical protein
MTRYSAADSHATRYINQLDEPTTADNTALFAALRHDDPGHAGTRYLAVLTARDERLALERARVVEDGRALDATAARITALATAVLEVSFTVDGVLGQLRWMTEDADNRAEFDALRSYLREQTGNLREIRDAS